MKKLIILIVACISFALNFNYSIPLSKNKIIQIQQSINLYQYLYDLEKLNEILKILNNPTFQEISYTAEMSIKTKNSLYTSEYINKLLKILNGIDPTNNSVIGYYDKENDIGGGYIKYIKDKFNNYYIFYLVDIPYKNLITKNFNGIEENIEKNFVILKKHYKEEKNLKIELKQIYFDLISCLNEIENETLKLKNENIIKPFNYYIDKKYSLPTKWAQIDGKTTLYEIIHFILNGDKNILGMKNYYEKFYIDDTKPFIIMR